MVATKEDDDFVDRDDDDAELLAEYDAPQQFDKGDEADEAADDDGALFDRVLTVRSVGVGGWGWGLYVWLSGTWVGGVLQPCVCSDGVNVACLQTGSKRRTIKLKDDQIALRADVSGTVGILHAVIASDQVEGAGVVPQDECRRQGGRGGTSGRETRHGQAPHAAGWMRHGVRGRVVDAHVGVLQEVELALRNTSWHIIMLERGLLKVVWPPRSTFGPGLLMVVWCGVVCRKSLGGCNRLRIGGPACQASVSVPSSCAACYLYPVSKGACYNSWATFTVRLCPVETQHLTSSGVGRIVFALWKHPKEVLLAVVGVRWLCAGSVFGTRRQRTRRSSDSWWISGRGISLARTPSSSRVPSSVLHAVKHLPRAMVASTFTVCVCRWRLQLTRCHRTTRKKTSLLDAISGSASQYAARVASCWRYIC